MAESDWDEVTYLRKKAPSAKQARSQQAVNSAMRRGETVETRTKFSAAQNKKHATDMNTSKLDRETEELHHMLDNLPNPPKYYSRQMPTIPNPPKYYNGELRIDDRVPLALGQWIQRGRQQKNLTQKELATKINEKPQVINDYEAGRAIPNQAILSKIERSIGLKLRGKDIGKPLGGKN